MPRLLILLLFLSCAVVAVGQERAVADSVLDSVHHVAGAADSLATQEKAYAARLASMKSGLTRQIDSLTKINLPTRTLTHRLDSLNRIDPAQAVRSRLLRAEGAMTGKVSALENKLKTKLQGATGELPQTPVQLPAGAGLPVPKIDASLPAIPGGALPTVPNVSLPAENFKEGASLENEAKALTTLPQKEISQLTQGGEGGAIQKEIGQAGQEVQKVSAYGKEVTSLGKGDLAKVEKLPGDLESEAKNLNEVKTLSKESTLVDGYKKEAAQLEDPAAMEKQVEKQAINHFAGKEAVLKNAMDRIAVLKQKYPSISSLSAIPKRPPNPMHGKRFVNRLVPGITFQVLRISRNVQIDVNPSLGYKFNGRLTAGFGWNERLGVNHRYHLRNLDHVYGPRLYGDYKLGKGFTARAVGELMNTPLPPNAVNPADPRTHAWIAGVFTGFKRDYKLTKNIRGNAQVLYNLRSLMGTHPPNIYGDPLIMRVGFEVAINRKGRGK